MITAETCFASLFTATERMVGRGAAWQIASASAMLAFRGLMGGFT